jgi:hypothetical protein
MKANMKVNIKNIINESFNQKNIENSIRVQPDHVKKAIEIIYPTVATELINKCEYFVKIKNENKNSNNTSPYYDISPYYDLSDVYLITKAYNFNKGNQETVDYALGLIMDFL